LHLLLHLLLKTLIAALDLLLLLKTLVTAHAGLLSLKKLIDGLVVLLFLSCILIENLFKLRVFSLLSVIGIFLDTNLFVNLLVLKERSFLLS